MSEQKEIEIKKTFELKEGQFSLDTLDDQIRYAKMLIEKRLISETFKDASQVIIAIQMCRALNLNPISGLKMLYVVGGKPALFGDATLSLVQSSGLLESIQEYFVNDKCEIICVANKNLTDEIFGAVCVVKRKGDDKAQEDFFTENDRIKAGLNSPVWSKYKKSMLRYRTRAMALKSKFPDVLNGMDIAEYTYQDLPQHNEITKTASEEINEAFKGE
jgi:hypothetical protein